MCRIMNVLLSRSVLVFATLCVFGLAAAEDGPFVQSSPEQGLQALRSTVSGRSYVVYVDAKPGEDISGKLQAAIDRVRDGYSGTVVCPPGQYALTRTVNLAGTLERFKKGGASNVTLDGNGATLIWNGPDEGAMIDMPGAASCTVRNLTLTGRRGKMWRKIIGIRHRGGIERKVHGGKNNRFERITLRNVGIGVEVGGIFGPDLVGDTFVGLKIWACRIGVHLLGQNVTGMVFINPLISSYEEAGFKIRGFGGRRIRASKEEDVPLVDGHGEPLVLMDPNQEFEIFQKDLPDWMTAEDVTYPTWWTKDEQGRELLWAGGGSLDITIYSLLGHSSHLNSWMIDTNSGAIRIYSARIEGPGGIFRSRLPVGMGRFSNLLMDLDVPTSRGMNNNAIEMHGAGPLYLIGGAYTSHIALGNNSVVYTLGTRFRKDTRNLSALLPLDFDEPLPDGVVDTGETRVVGQLRGKARVVRIPNPTDLGFRQLPGTSGARVHELTQSSRLTASVPEGKTSKKVDLTGMNGQPDGNYDVAITPNFDAGGVWVSSKERDHLVVNFPKPAPEGATLGIMIQHSPYRGLGAAGE